MITVDASVAIKWFVAEAGSGEAQLLLSEPEPLIAPDFVILETLNVLRRKCKRGEIGAAQLKEASGALVGSFDLLLPAKAFVEQTMSLSGTLDHGTYDCAYLACAIRHQARLITADEVFARRALANGFQGTVALLK